MCAVSSTDKVLFLETTIQVDRVIGTLERRQTIRRNTDGRHLCTSGYVLAEYNRTLIRDAITFRDILRTSPSVDDAILRSRKYSRSRKFLRMISILAHLGIDKDKQTTLERLEDFIEWKALDHFWESIDKSCCVDEVKCALRLWEALLGETGEYEITGLKCQRAMPVRCNVQDFIEKNRDILKGFVSTASGHSNSGIAEAAEAFQAILEGRDVPFGERSCYRLGDTLIVLEASSESDIYSSDGDIRDICEILGRSLHKEEPVKL